MQNDRHRNAAAFSFLLLLVHPIGSGILLRMRFENDSAAAMGRTVMDLVAIKSLSGDEAGMADYVQSHLSKLGFDCVRDAQDNVLAIVEPCRPGTPSDTLHLSGHTDTVVPVEGWTSDPWTPLQSGSGDEQRITGLGASDMKSGL